MRNFHLESLHQIRIDLVTLLRISRMYHVSFPTTGQLGLTHHSPDPLVVDLPASTAQGFGDATIAIAGKGFPKFLNGIAQPLIVLLVHRGTAMLIVPLPVDQERAAQLAEGQLLHLLPKPIN